MRRKIWKVKEFHREVNKLAEKYNLPSLLIQVLRNRNIAEEDFESFLDSDSFAFHDPRLLPDITAAARRIKLAASSQEKVLVFGDYDVDGITSLAIFNEYAKSLKGIFSFYIPHRVKEGYGLNRSAILRAKEEGITLIIAFDCGTNALEEVNLASSLDIDVIVVDHHSIKGRRQPECLFINPKRSDSNYPSATLSTGALSFKLLQVLTAEDCYQVLDLVALSIICDVVPLQGENRFLLNKGIQALKTSQRPAIKALAKVSGIRQANIDTFHIGYILGPRINASGRVAHAKESLELFLTDDEHKALDLATKLSEYNKLRKNIEAQILKEAEQYLASNLNQSSSIVVTGENWHQGVLGIVASRLADKYGKPSFVISFDKEVGKGSARSIQNVHLIEMLDQCADLLLGYGGHRKAAGVHISKTELDSFKDKINVIIAENIASEDFIPLLEIDAAVTFSDIQTELVEGLEKLKPHGEGNPVPYFFSSNIFKKSQPKKISYGFSVWLSDGQKTFEALVYDKEILEIINYSDRLDIVFTLAMNNYHNMPRLVVRDCRFFDSEG